MTEVLQGVEEYCDFQNWSPADLMAFVERVLPGPAHQATVETIRRSGLDGNYIGELVRETTPSLPIPVASYWILKVAARDIVRKFEANQSRLADYYKHGWNLQRRLRWFLNWEIEDRSRRGEMGGATLVRRDDDEIEVVMDDIVRLRRCLDMHTVHIGRLLYRGYDEQENRELVRFSKEWVYAAHREYRNRRRGASPRRVVVPWSNVDRPLGMERNVGRRDAEQAPVADRAVPQGEPEQEPNELQIAPQGPVEEPRPQAPREPEQDEGEPVQEEMEQDPVEPVIAEQRERERHDMRFLADHLLEREQEDEEQEEMEQEGEEEDEEEEEPDPVIAEQIERILAVFNRNREATRDLIRRQRLCDGLRHHQELISRRIRELQRNIAINVALGDIDLDAIDDIERQIGALEEERNHLNQEEQRLSEEFYRDAFEMLANAPERPFRPEIWHAPNAPNEEPEPQ